MERSRVDIPSRDIRVGRVGVDSYRITERVERKGQGRFLFPVDEGW